MPSINPNNTTAMLQLSSSLQLHNKSEDAIKALQGTGALDSSDAIPFKSKGNGAEEVREKFTQFVGETFYGQMFKAMRSTVDKPAYFHGGRAEEAFQGQLDQTMAEHMTKASASTFAEPMFERQFPSLAKSTRSSNDLGQLTQLSRR
jgi:hypothetical protein